MISKIVKMNSHEIDFEPIGEDIQIVEIELDLGETVIQKQELWIKWKTMPLMPKMGDGSLSQHRVLAVKQKGGVLFLVVLGRMNDGG